MPVHRQGVIVVDRGRASPGGPASALELSIDITPSSTGAGWASSAKPSGGHRHHMGARVSTAVAYLYMASTRDMEPSSRHARHLARSTVFHIEGVGLPDVCSGPASACWLSAYNRSRSSSLGGARGAKGSSSRLLPPRGMTSASA
eukprot:scaffold151823_cov23-Tisochrysis_lutea.AAC.1